MGKGWGTRAILSATIAAVVCGHAAAFQNITLSIVPVGGTTVDGGQLVTVEIFVTAAAQSQEMRGTQIDLPCSLPGGLEGTITTGNADSNPATMLRVFSTGSSGGIPFLFSNGLGPVNQNTCLTAGTPAIGTFSASLGTGQTRYLATYVYGVSNCAAGEFDLFFEGADNPPTMSSRTRILVPDGPDLDINDDIIPFRIIETTLTVPVGRCCVGSDCLGQASEHCCRNLMGGTSWESSFTCDDGCPCITAADCSDGVSCTVDDCDDGRCVNRPDAEQCDDGFECTEDRCNVDRGRCENVDRGCVYGDVSAMGRDCHVDDTDMDCVLDGFAAARSCLDADVFPCETDGEVTFDDVLAISESIVNRPPCSDPEICP